MTDRQPDDLSVFEPLAAAIRHALDASGMSQAEAARATGLSEQLVSQLVNRKKPYRAKAPDPATQQALERIPGLSIGAIQTAVARSMGMAIGDDRPQASQLRQTAHNLVDQIPEAELTKAVRMLTVMIES